MRKRISWVILILCSLVLIFAGSFYLFSSHVGTLSNANVENQLIEATQNNLVNATSLVEKDTNQLEGLALQFAKTINLDNEKEVKNLLQGVISYTSYNHIILYTTNHIYSDDSSLKYEKDEDVKNVMSHGKTILSSLNNHTYVGIAVPIMNNNKVIGVLRGVYQQETMSKLLNFTLFNNMGHYGIFGNDGYFLYHSENFEDMKIDNNLFHTLENTKFYKNYSLDKTKNNISDHKSFFSRYELSGEEYIAFYVPFGIGNWYMMSVVPISYFSDFNNSIDGSALLLMAVMGIIFAILLYVIVILNKKENKHLQNNIDSMERIINTMPVPVFIIDENYKISQLNSSAIETFHIRKEDVVGKLCMNMDETSSAIERLIHENEKNTFMEIDDSQYLVSTTILNDGHEKLIGYIAVLQDITKLINVQRDLEERSLELETISENLVGGILITTLDEGFPVISCNQGYLDMVGCLEEDVVGSPATKWLLKEETETIEESIFKQLESNQIVQLEHLLQRHDGKKMWVFLYGKKAILNKKNVGIWLLINIDESKQAEQKIKLNEEKYRIAIDNTNNIIMDYDIEKDIMLHNEKVIEIYGVDPLVEHPKEKIVEMGLIAKESIAVFESIFDQVKKGIKKVECDILTIDKNNEHLWGHFTFTTIFDDIGVPVRAIGILDDFTKEKNAVLQYQREAQYRKLTVEDSALYYEADLTQRIFLTGYEDLVKAYATRTTNDFDTVVQLMVDHLVYENDREKVYSYINYSSLMDCYNHAKTKVEFEYQRVLNKNETGWVHCTIYILKDEITDNIRVIGYIKDIDESKKLELYLKEQAEKDLLTGLYNKMTTEHLIKNSLDNLKENDLATLMIIDLDDFKNINDTFGHAFGDAVLSEVSQQLTKLFAEKGIVGRIGGDEFIVFLNHLSSKQEAQESALSICEFFHNAYTDANNYKVCGSVGLSFAPYDGKSFDELYQNADAALYSAKNSGKDQYCIYDSSLPQVRTNALSRVIDINAGKQFSTHNMGEYVFRILYETKNPENLVNAILELVSKQLHYSRGYVFEHVSEGDYWINTYEWCARGIVKQKVDLQRFEFEEKGYFESFFNEKGEFMIYDTHELNTELVQLTEKREVKSFIHIAIKHDGVIKGFIGFDDCKKHWIPGQEDIDTLHIIVMLLDAFVFREKRNDR